MERVGRKVKKGSGFRVQGSGKGGFLQTPSPEPRTLFHWYSRHRRILPWRALPGERADPYRVWLSEIMLQQTTVAAVAPYFQKFIARWPTVALLARAHRDDVLKMWAGLGYYRRAHLLHECAAIIHHYYGGEFPHTENELRKLPGFGAYTAAAVAAIAFDRPANVVDGNVERVMARIFAIRTALPGAKMELRAAAATLLPSARHGDYAQALMDLGATICTPRNPKCDLCPWRNACRARQLEIQNELPRRAAKKKKPLRRAIAFFVINTKGEVLLRRRPAKGLLGGMMEIPSSAWKTGAMPDLAIARAEAPVKARWTMLPGTVRHVFSHFELEVAVACATIADGQGIWVPVTKLDDEALPSVMKKILRHGMAALPRGKGRVS